MSNQFLSQIVVLIGAIISALGAFGSYHYGKIQETATADAATKEQEKLTREISDLKQVAGEHAKQTTLIAEFLNVKPDKWMEVRLDNIPPGVADFALLLFKTDHGRISGKVRIKGSSRITSFSTTPNSKTPVAVANRWDAQAQQYTVPTILEFSVTEQTVQTAKLSILTAGWIDTRGKEPHL